MAPVMERFVAQEAVLCAEPGPSVYAVGRGALYAVAGGGAILSGVTLLSGLSGVALVVATVAAAAFFFAGRVIDYGDEAVRTSLRREIYGHFLAVRALHERGIDVSDWVQRLLDEVIEKHGFTALNNYGIIRPDHFAEMFAFQKEVLPFSETFPLYVRLAAGLQGDIFQYGVTPPEGFTEEVNQIDIAQLLEGYEPQDLFDAGMVDDSQRDFLLGAKDQLSEKFAERRGKMEKNNIVQHEKAMEMPRAKCATRKRKARRTYEASLCHWDKKAHVRELGLKLAAAFAEKEEGHRIADEKEEIRKLSLRIQKSDEDVDRVDRSGIEKKYSAESERVIGEYFCLITTAEEKRRRVLEIYREAESVAEKAFDQEVCGAKRERGRIYEAWIGEYTALVTELTREFRRQRAVAVEE